MRRRLVVLLAVAAAGLGAADVVAAPAADLRVRHGLAIGPVRLGMTLPEVRRVLGVERAVNKRERRRGGYVYLELDWDYSWWTVGFMRGPAGPYRAVLVATRSRTQRTRENLGVGTLRSELYRRLPSTRCWYVFARASGNILHTECRYARRGLYHTVFVLEKWDGHGDDTPGLTTVEGVEVRHPLFYRGWRVNVQPSP